MARARAAVTEGAIRLVDVATWGAVREPFEDAVHGVPGDAVGAVLDQLRESGCCAGLGCSAFAQDPFRSGHASAADLVVDDQLFATFARCQDLLREPPVPAASRTDLREKLNVEAGGVVFTTIQKFFPEERGDRHPVLSQRRNIVVIADEANRIADPMTIFP